MPTKSYEVKVPERKQARKAARNEAKKEGNVLRVKNVKKHESKKDVYIVTGEVKDRKPPREKKKKGKKKSKKKSK